MAKIINFSLDGKSEDLVPIEQWDGDCWNTFFKALEEMAEANGTTAWDLFASFMKQTFFSEQKGN